MLEPAPAAVPEAHQYLNLRLDALLAVIYGRLERDKQLFQSTCHATGRHATLVVENTSRISAVEQIRAVP